MKILLDTCTFIWIIQNETKLLTSKAKKIYLDRNNTLYLSVISFWEIITKYQTGKIYFEKPPEEFLLEECFTHNIEQIPLDAPSVFQLSHLESHHKDPFDRMLICQARNYDLTILSPDKIFLKYNIETIW